MSTLDAGDFITEIIEYQKDIINKIFKNCIDLKRSG